MGWSTPKLVGYPLGAPVGSLLKSRVARFGLRRIVGILGRAASNVPGATGRRGGSDGRILSDFWLISMVGERLINVWLMMVDSFWWIPSCNLTWLAGKSTMFNLGIHGKPAVNGGFLPQETNRRSVLINQLLRFTRNCTWSTPKMDGLSMWIYLFGLPTRGKEHGVTCSDMRWEKTNYMVMRFTTGHLPGNWCSTMKWRQLP